MIQEKENYKIYMHVNKTNQKRYIGITSQEPEQRWGSNGNGYKKNPYFNKAIEKYDWKRDFRHIVICKGLTKEEAEYFEILLIKAWKSNERQFGYNIASGGFSTGKHSKETKKKISIARKGKYKGINCPTSKKVSCGGKTFDSITACANYYGILPSTMTQWLNKKTLMQQKFIDLELHYIGEKFNKKDYKASRLYSKEVYCDGKIFNSITDCANYYNVNPSNMSSWLILNRAPLKFVKLGLRYNNNQNLQMQTNCKGVTLQITKKGADNANSKKVYCDNKIFGFVGECADYYNIKNSTMRGWLNGTSNIPKKFEKLGLRYLYGDYTPKHKENIGYKKVICDGMVFNKITDCANYYNVSQSKMSSWLNRRCNTPKEFVDLGLRLFDDDSPLNIIKDRKKGNNPNAKMVYCEGMIFDCIKDCSDYYNISYSAMKNWLSDNKMPQKFINLKLHFKDDKFVKPTLLQENGRKIICNNKIFDIARDCSEHYGVNEGTLRQWLLGINPMPEKFVNLGLRYLDDENFIPKTKVEFINAKAKKVICENNIFDSITKCSKYYNVGRTTMGNWLREDKLMPQKYIDLGLRYYNPEVDGDIEQYEQYIETKAI